MRRVGLIGVCVLALSLTLSAAFTLRGENYWPTCGQWMPCQVDIYVSESFAIVGTVAFGTVQREVVSPDREYVFLSGNPAGARAVLSRYGVEWFWTLDHPEYGHAEGFAH